ncbi:MAG TPA: hypothetical protein VFY82_15520, partial [Acidimicrobiales bacterium]|nr:hypothetical protein [Acidimicrobiales bacterium]
MADEPSTNDQTDDQPGIPHGEPAAPDPRATEAAGDAAPTGGTAAEAASTREVAASTDHPTHDGGADVSTDDGGAPAGDDHVDELPEDLDAAGFVGPYLFPNNNRRRVPGYLYLATAAVCVAVWALVDDSPYVNDGFLFAAVLLGLVGVYQLVSGWNLDVDEQDALVAASRTVGFPIGHASAQMG